MSNAKGSTSTGTAAAANTNAEPPLKPLDLRAIGNSGGALNWYWVGLTEDCPIENCTVGGVAFVKRRGIVTMDERTRKAKVTHYAPGDLVRISDEQRKRIREKAPKQIVRNVTNSKGDVVRSMRVVYEKGRYVHEEHDDHLMRFMYMVRADNGKRGVEIPDPLYQLGKDD